MSNLLNKKGNAVLDDVRALIVFEQVAKTESFRQAASELDLSPASVSNHIAKLEEALDATLFYRTTRRVSLTDEGRLLLPYAEQMVTAAQEGIDRLAERTEAVSGQLRITAPALMSNGFVADAALAFSQSYPKVDVFVSFSDQRVDLVRDGFDLSIRVGWLQDSSFKARKLGDASRGLFASQRYIDLRGMPERPDDLRDHDWIQFTLAPDNLHLTHEGTGEVVDVRPNARIRTDNSFAAEGFCRGGAGFAALPTIQKYPGEGDPLVEILPRWLLPSAGIYAVWHAQARHEGLVKRFVDFLVAYRKQ